ncbi:MAG: Hsp20/alpha crystallin family protein [Candidatus Krumholzibacteriia bacterium]
MNTLFPVNQLLEAAFAPVTNGNTQERTWRDVPRADILEGEKDFVIRMMVPGIDAANLEIHLENQVLTVKAERQLEFPEGYRVHRRELPDRVALRRSFDVGRGIDGDRIGARLEDGVLTITLPKSEQHLPRRIEVQ